MTTRAERTRTLLNLPDLLRQMKDSQSAFERTELYWAIMRHYPCSAEWDAIADKAPEWLEKREC